MRHNGKNSRNSIHPLCPHHSFLPLVRYSCLDSYPFVVSSADCGRHFITNRKFHRPEAEKAAPLPQEESIDRITVKDGSRIHIIKVEDLLYIQACGDYATLVTSDGEYIKEQTMKSLKRAQRLLKEQYPGYSLIVYDAARPLSVQQKMWNVVKGTSKYIYVSNPSRGGGLHNYGLAVDISILDDKGTPLPMGTPVDHLGREAHITEEAVLVAQGKLTEQERENRLLLRQVMKEAGFHPLPSEWWHFNRVSRQTAKERYRVIP